MVFALNARIRREAAPLRLSSEPYTLAPHSQHHGVLTQPLPNWHACCRMDAGLKWPGGHRAQPAHAMPTICPQLQVTPVSYRDVFRQLERGRASD